MRSLPRIALWSLLVLVAPALSGCANFDPDSLDIFGLNEKKKLPGERKDLFPEGVPGVSQGIPPEYRMGNQPTADAAPSIPPEPAAEPQRRQAAAPVQQEKPKPKRTVKRTAPKPAPAAAAAPVAPVQSQSAPPVQTTQQPASGWPAPAQGTTSSSGSSAWPAPQPSGTFQR